MISILRRIIATTPKRAKTTLTGRPFHLNPPPTNQILKPAALLWYPNHQTCRHKSKKGKGQPQKPDESESGTETNKDNWEDQLVDKSTKIMEVSVKSLRVDLLLKAGLGIARNKIETLFYESKIRVNGEKLLKKSESVQEKDEIDIVKGTSVENPDFLTVARVEVLEVKGKGDSFVVKLRRTKNLTVENYERRALT